MSIELMSNQGWRNLFAKRLYEQMVPGVLAWNGASNNKAFLGKEVHWTNNTISIYVAAKGDPTLRDGAEDMDHADWPVGPVGHAAELHVGSVLTTARSRRFGVMSNGRQHVPVDMRLYLPKVWIDDVRRCDEAGVPAAARQLTSKSQHALDIVRSARAAGRRFNWSGFDAGYGKEPAFLRALEDDDEVFVADVHRNQKVWLEDSGLHVPERWPGRGRRTAKLQAACKPVTVEAFVKGLAPQAWTRCNLRDRTRGPLRVDIAHRLVFVWDGVEALTRC